NTSKSPSSTAEMIEATITAMVAARVSARDGQLTLRSSEAISSETSCVLRFVHSQIAAPAVMASPMTVLQVHSPAKGRVSGWVGPNAPKPISSTCSRNRPAASARTTYPMAMRRLLVMVAIGSEWQASQDSNLEHAVLETAALPLELL